MGITKTILIAEVIIGLAVFSASAQEGCDGGVFVTGSTVNTCGSCSESAPTCPGSTTHRDDYYHCGGYGYTYCSQSDTTIGHSGMSCTVTIDLNAAQSLQVAYDDCVIDSYRNSPPRTCPHQNHAIGPHAPQELPVELL